MHQMINVENKVKRKNNKDELHLYWRIFIPVTALLGLMIFFPLRIDQREAFLDSVFYGSISLACLATAFRVFQWYGKQSRWIVVIIVICSILSGWHVLDMAVLRYEGTPAYTFAGSANVFEPLHDGWAWYGLRFRNDEIVCHSLFERYIGNNFLAIAYDIDRFASWFACGG